MFYRCVLQLAIADALFLLTIPFKVYEDIYQNLNLSTFVCVDKETVVHLNYNASVLFLVVGILTHYKYSYFIKKFKIQYCFYIIYNRSKVVKFLLIKKNKSCKF